jgi:hypothetical protein
MARNSSGTHSLPAGTNPVVTGTQITPTWANGTMTDISAELTDSLSRSGKGGMTAPLRTADGTVAAPAHSFSNETGTGWYRSGAGFMSAAILGSIRFWAWASGVVARGTLGIQDPTGGKTTFVQSPSGLAADQTITLPNALPGSTLPVNLSAAGVLTAQAITRPGLPTVGQQISLSCGTGGGASTTSATYVDVTNLTVTITTTGRPVTVMLQPDGSVSGPGLLQSEGTTDNTAAFYAINRGGAVIFETGIAVNVGASGSTTTTISFPAGSLFFVDPVGAGTYTYKVQFKRNSATDTAKINYCKLVAFEL